jgi:imidazolonepropionase-like amidohydrolase
VKYHHIDRQRGPRSETRYIVRNGAIVGGEVWQLPLYGPEPVPRPPAFDRFEVVRDSVLWRVRDSTRGARVAPGSFYRLRSNTPYDVALAARFLLARPDRSAQFLPTGGTARVEIVADTTVRAAGRRQRVRLAMIHTRGNPAGVWLDERNELFSSEVSGWFAVSRPGTEDAHPALRAMEFAYRNARGADVAKRLAPPAASAIAIVNGDVFDSERGVLLPRHTVVIRGDRIVAVGRSDSVSVPQGASIIDAAGKTVMPGMVDMHTHAFLQAQSSSSLAHLALGITTIRDVAADLDIATQLRDRSAKGEIVSPRVVLAGFIEGPGRWAGPSEAIVATEAEARAWVARYDSAGYKQIKLYNLVQQDLVPAIADETHKRGMRLSGHVPRGLSTPAAVRLGFDEINHAAFLFSTFYPESLYVPVMRAYSAVSQIVAPNVNVDGPEVTSMIQLFRERGTVIDGTWNLWLAQRTPNAGLGIPATPDTLAQKLDQAYMRMLKRLFDAGVPIVPGTDGSSYNVELELYEKSGIPAPEVLRIATIVPAKVMKDDANYGSIAVGKVADIIIVDGRPTERVSDLRKVERVIRAGRPYEVKALQAALQQ